MNNLNNINNINNLSVDNLLNIIQILVKDYEHELNNLNKFYEEKLSIYIESIESKDNQIDYLELQVNELIDDYHTEITKNIELEKELKNSHLK
jgi:ABC-type antimicrobial peptide transport system permease subunit